MDIKRVIDLNGEIGSCHHLLMLIVEHNGDAKQQVYVDQLLEYFTETAKEAFEYGLEEGKSCSLLNQ